MIRSSNGLDENSYAVEVICSGLISMSSVNKKAVAELVISECLSSLSKSFHGISEKELEGHSSWKEVSILVRIMVTLSFDDNIDVMHHLPALLHTLLLYIGRGSPMQRRTGYSLLMNLLHNIKLHKTAFEDVDSEISDLQTRLSDIKYSTLFGLQKVVSSRDNQNRRYPLDTWHDDPEIMQRSKEATVIELEAVADILWDTLRIASNSEGNHCL